MKTYAIYFSITLCCVIAALYWIDRARIHDFQSYHRAIGRESASSSANEIARFVREKKRLVNIFAGEYADLIDALARAPEDEQLHATLQEKITQFFPDFFSFTVTDANGTPYLHDFDDFIGDFCQADLSEFAQSSRQRPRIHPHSETYHFDILAPYSAQGDTGILFISFNADLLGDTLGASQTSGHRLLLVRPEASELIEVSAEGARIHLPRDDFRLSAAERSRILYRERVPDTSWDVVDLHEPGLFENHRQTILFHSAIILLLLSLISLFMLFLVRREEKLRRVAEAHKDEFVAVVSHELRTPLTSIRGSLGLMAGGAGGQLDEQNRQLVNIAIRNCERLSVLVDDILDLRKIEAGEFTLVKEPVDLVAVIRQSIEANQGYAAQFGARFELQTASESLPIDIDAARIQQVMANLLSNAAKYGGNNDTIDIRVERQAHTVRVAVTDHGAGVPEGFRRRIFQKFAQHDASSVRKVGGTGLGLNITKHIVELHGGQVGLESESGAGATFWFELPLTAPSGSA